ncbi:AcrR family transcriptional regulator [Motilibacter peucedani]|uniref:AcrR family transcriptional regulator n=1 Tax=Motilibacter peucedani TaxID=598650 RepID=A0A420XQG4_9ACTN|nr:TetR/AcrR family transcriptional regulator [Motilibacter peucedani]RKS75533.1 AcrR family transcriptional regulator [Motilibacter peucedani]
MTLDWTALAAGPEPAGEGLRERKKRQTRRLLSATATRLFLENGFHAVRVADVAAACGVSEKTVFNYFPTKESLLLDLWAGTAGSLERLREPGASPVKVVLDVLGAELDELTAWLGAQPDPDAAAQGFRRFGRMLRETPSLRAYQRDTFDRLTGVAAAALAERSRAEPGDLRPLAAAHALLGLWSVQFASLARHVGTQRAPAPLAAAVTADVRRAAALLVDGLATLDGP